MDWAYRMIGLHPLDALGGMIVMHLGWRDHPSMRTDRAIARALCRSRAAVQAATRKLAAQGVIERCPKGLTWLACETVAIVRGDASGLEPDAASRDVAPAPREGRTRERTGPERGPGGGPERGPQPAPREGHMRKRKEEKEPAALLLDLEKVPAGELVALKAAWFALPGSPAAGSKPSFEVWAQAQGANCLETAQAAGRCSPL